MIKQKWRVPILSKSSNFVNNSRNCTKFEALGDLIDAPLIWHNLGPTSRDLSMTVTIFLNFGPFSFELKTLGEKVGYCQSLPSSFVLLGASYSVY